MTDPSGLVPEGSWGDCGPVLAYQKYLELKINGLHLRLKDKAEIKAVIKDL